MTQKDNDDPQSWPSERRSVWWCVYGASLVGILLVALMSSLHMVQAKQIRELRVAVRDHGTYRADLDFELKELRAGLESEKDRGLRFEKEVLLRFVDVVKECRGIDADLYRLRSEVRSHRAQF